MRSMGWSKWKMYEDTAVLCGDEVIELPIPQISRLVLVLVVVTHLLVLSHTRRWVPSILLMQCEALDVDQSPAVSYLPSCFLRIPPTRLSIHPQSIHPVA